MQKSKERIQSKISQLKTWVVQTLKFCAHTGKVNQDLEKSNPPYPSNGDRLGKYFCTILFKTLENGGVGHLQIPKKNSKSGQNAHVTQKPQIFNIFQTLHF
jgi:hypothetical protein